MLAEKAADEGPFSVDECLVRAGGWSTYQWRLIVSLGACTAVVSGHMLQPIFLVSLITDFGTLSPFQQGMISSVFFAGYLVGVFFWASVSDAGGRRPALRWSFGVCNLAGIASFAAPNFALFLALRFVAGFGGAGAKNAAFLMGTEFAPPNARAKTSVLLSYSWLAGLLLLVAVARALRGWHWRWLVTVHILPAVATQLALRSLPESPRYLLVAGDVERAKHILRLIFRANGHDAPEPLCLQQPATSGAERSTMAQLWRRSARRSTVIVGFSQAVCTMTFYAITFSSKLNMTTGDLYVGALLGALVELP